MTRSFAAAIVARPMPRDWSELFVVAPATADLLARIVAGMGNDALAATLLAYRGTVLLAPAMNTAMWEHPATQRNLALLAKDTRYRFVGPGAGLLACGEIGSGRLSERPPAARRRRDARRAIRAPRTRPRAA